MENQEVHFIGVVNIKGSTAEKLNIVYMAGYQKMPGAWEYWQLHNMLSHEENYKNIMCDIILVPFSEATCRTEEEVQRFRQMREEMFKKSSEQ